MNIEEEKKQKVGGSYIISLGGSIIVPSPGEINIKFLREFKKFILEQVNLKKKFVIICGGGKTARNYQAAATAAVDLSLNKKSLSEDLDWIGIHATHLNAQLIKTIFGNFAYKKFQKNPTVMIKTKKPIIVAAGWQPGCSTDYDAVLLAKTYGSKTIINLTNVDYVYDKNPKLYRDAKPIKKIKWSEYRKLIGSKWKPGLSAPFDPIAAKYAQKYKLKVIIFNGYNIKNIKNFLDGRNFIGTIIE